MRARTILGALGVALFTSVIAHAASPEDVWILHDDSGFGQPACRDCPRLSAWDAVRHGGAARGVIVTGHSTFGNYVGQSPQLLARTIARISPEAEFLVLDTCYGAEAELLAELHRAGARPAVTFAPAEAVHPEGFDYGDLLLQDTVSAADLAARWETSPGGVAQITMIPSAALSVMVSAIEQTREEARRCGRTGGFVSILPTLAPIRIQGVNGPVLVHLRPSDLPAECFSPAPATGNPTSLGLAWGSAGGALLLVAAHAALRARRRRSC